MSLQCQSFVSWYSFISLRKRRKEKMMKEFLLVIAPIMGKREKLFCRCFTTLNVTIKGQKYDVLFFNEK